MTTPIGPTTPSSTPVSQVLGKQQPATAPTEDKTNLDKDAFLKLLVDQLKYQDPMNPAQGTEFLAQTAQFTTVEKLTDLAEVQQQMLTAQLTLGAANMIGRTVSYNDANGNATTGAVTGATLGTNPTVTVNGLAIPLSSISTIGQAGATPAAETGEPITPVQGVGSRPAAGTPAPTAGTPATTGTPGTATPIVGTPATGAPAATTPAGTPAVTTPTVGTPGAPGVQTGGAPPPLTTSPPGSSPVTGAPGAPATGAPATSTPTPGGQVTGGQNTTIPSLNDLPTAALPITLPQTLPTTNPSVPAGTATSPVTGQPLSTQPAAQTAPNARTAAPAETTQPAQPTEPATTSAGGISP